MCFGLRNSCWIAWLLRAWGVGFHETLTLHLHNNWLHHCQGAAEGSNVGGGGLFRLGLGHHGMGAHQGPHQGRPRRLIIVVMCTPSNMSSFKHVQSTAHFGHLDFHACA